VRLLYVQVTLVPTAMVYPTLPVALLAGIKYVVEKPPVIVNELISPEPPVQTTKSPGFVVSVSDAGTPPPEEGPVV
jgi:hypothetical protein